MTHTDTLRALDVIAAHVHGSIVRLDNVSAEIAAQRLDLAVQGQTIERLRASVLASQLMAESVVQRERRNVDTHELVGAIRRRAS